MPVIAGAARWVSRSLVLVVFSLMLALNVAALTLTGVANLMAGGLASLGVETVLARSERKLARAERNLSATKADLSKTRAKLNSAETRLAGTQRALARTQAELDRTKGRMGEAGARATKAEHDLRGARSRLSMREGELAEHRGVVRRIATRIARRTEVGAVRNIGAMIGESVPFYGAAVVVGVTGWEITDACLTMQDIEELSRAFNVAEADVDRETVCGLTVPTVEELKEASTLW